MVHTYAIILWCVTLIDVEVARRFSMFKKLLRYGLIPVMGMCILLGVANTSTVNVCAAGEVTESVLDGTTDEVDESNGVMLISEEDGQVAPETATDKKSDADGSGMIIILFGGLLLILLVVVIAVVPTIVSSIASVTDDDDSEE